jgi:hypothetical protein
MGNPQHSKLTLSSENQGTKKLSNKGYGDVIRTVVMKYGLWRCNEASGQPRTVAIEVD